MKKHLNLVAYFGGKYPHLNWLIPLLPKGNFHFIDAMCGAANVALNVNYPLVTINDLNDEIVNLFEVLRNSSDEFLRRLYFTPFAATELHRCIDQDIPTDPIERARRYFVRCQLGYGANGSQNNHKGAGFEFTLQRSNYYRVDNWNQKLDKLPYIINRLRHFQILSKDVFEVMDKMDRPNNIIFLDPPYVLSTRSQKRYRHECSDAFHEQLCNRILNVKHAHVALSGYDNEIYRDILTEYQMTTGLHTQSNVGKKEAQECLWTNYNPTNQLTLFSNAS